MFHCIWAYFEQQFFGVMIFHQDTGQYKLHALNVMNIMASRADGKTHSSLLLIDGSEMNDYGAI